MQRLALLPRSCWAACRHAVLWPQLSCLADHPASTLLHQLMHQPEQVFGSSADGKGERGANGESKGERELDRERDRRGSTGGGRGGRDGGDRRKSGGRGGGRGDGKDGGKQGGGSVSADLQKLVGLIKDKHFEPTIVFSFSRRWVLGMLAPCCWRVCEKLVGLQSRASTDSRRLPSA